MLSACCAFQQQYFVRRKYQGRLVRRPHFRGCTSSSRIASAPLLVDSRAMPTRMPSPFAIYAITVAGVFGILTTARGLVDSDYYWHIMAGRLVAERGVLQTDPFSYTWGGQSWVMHEWLGELVMHWLIAGVGVGISTFLFGVASISGPLILAWALRRQGVALLPLTIATSLVVYLFASYATIRPQAISWLLLGLLLAGLVSVRPERRWRPWLVIPLMVIWANVHGLYVIGLGVLGLYVLFTLIGRTPMSPRRWEMVGVLAAAIAASMVTPAGPEGLVYPLRYVDAGDWGLSHISEWQSPDFHDPTQLGLLGLDPRGPGQRHASHAHLVDRHGRVRRRRSAAGHTKRSSRGRLGASDPGAGFGRSNAEERFSPSPGACNSRVGSWRSVPRRSSWRRP